MGLVWPPMGACMAGWQRRHCSGFGAQPQNPAHRPADPPLGPFGTPRCPGQRTGLLSQALLAGLG